VLAVTFLEKNVHWNVDSKVYTSTVFKMLQYGY